MALFGGSSQKETKGQRKESGILDKQRQEINAVDGKYYAHKFTISELISSDGDSTAALYKNIVEFANNHLLEIKSISRTEDNGGKTKSASVIFEKK